jgi:hypothetical protein
MTCSFVDGAIHGKIYLGTRKAVKAGEVFHRHSRVWHKLDSDKFVANALTPQRVVCYLIK